MDVALEMDCTDQVPDHDIWREHRQSQEKTEERAQDRYDKNGKIVQLPPCNFGPLFSADVIVKEEEEEK